MYLSTDDARSDFFLVAATYLIGGLLLSFALDLVGGLFDNVIGDWLLTIAIPFLLIAAMPLWLMRYREETRKLLWYGEPSGLLLGAGYGLMIAAGAALVAPLAGQAPWDAIPVAVWLQLVTGVGADGAAAGGGLTLDFTRLLLSRIVQWTALAVLVVFMFRRGEYAWRPISERYEVLAQQAGLVAVGGALAASLLLVPTGGSFLLLGAPIGCLVALLYARSRMMPSGMGERWQLWAPLVVLALGEIAILSFLGAAGTFLQQVRSAGMVAAFGLLGMLAMADRRGTTPIFGMALTIALLSPVTAFGAGL